MISLIVSCLQALIAATALAVMFVVVWMLTIGDRPRERQP